MTDDTTETRLKNAIASKNVELTAQLTIGLRRNVRLDVITIERALATILEGHNSETDYSDSESYSGSESHIGKFDNDRYYVSCTKLFHALLLKRGWENYVLLVDGICLWTKFDEKLIEIFLGVSDGFLVLSEIKDNYMAKAQMLFTILLPKVLKAFDRLDGYQEIKAEIAARLISAIKLNYNCPEFYEYGTVNLGILWNFVAKYADFSSKHVTAEIFNYSINQPILEQIITTYPGQNYNALETAACAKQRQVSLILLCLKSKCKYKIVNPSFTPACEKALRMLVANKQIPHSAKGDELEGILNYLSQFSKSEEAELYLKLKAVIQDYLKFERPLANYLDLKKHGLKRPELVHKIVPEDRELYEQYESNSLKKKLLSG